jgi:PTS system fructose-specific IIC component
MKISEILIPQTIQVAQRVSNKIELIDTLIDLACKTGKVIDKHIVKSEVLKREEIMSTGIGDGIAIPHAKSNYVSDTICSIVILNESVEYNAIDGQPINIAFMLLGRENNVGSHLRILSKISRFLSSNNNIENLIKCKTPKDVYDYLVSTDEK